MIRGAARAGNASMSIRAARRALTGSARRFAEPDTTPGKPVTSQSVKAELHKNSAPVVPAAAPATTAVKAKVQENNQQQVPPKKFSLFGFLWKTALASSVIYLGTLYTATKNDRVMDFVINNQLPYHDEIIDLMENGSKVDLEEAWLKVTSVFTPKKIGELTTKLEQRGEHLIEETKKKLTHDQTLPAHQLQKVEFEIVPEKMEKIPFVTLKDGAMGFADESVKATIASFNELINLVDGSNLGPHKDAMVKKINENISALSSKLAALNNSFETELKAKLKDSETDLMTLYTQKELELTQTMLDQYNFEKDQLKKKYQDQLTREVAAAQQAISQAAVNATTMVRIEQTKRFEAMIKERVDQERDGRLKNLEAVNSRLEDLEKFALSLEKQISASSSRTLIQRAAGQLKSLLFNTPEDAAAVGLYPYVAHLESATSKANDEVISLAIAELKVLLKNESSQSLLTVPQLLTSWEQLAPELRSASLLPPNAGLLGHLASILFSKLLIPVKGAKPEGRDIESVIGRVENSLIHGDLDVAVEEAANLKGWTRRLANDWIVEGRKRLEAEFLVSLIDAETRIM